MKFAYSSLSWRAIIIMLFFVPDLIEAQIEKKTLSSDDFDIWKRISNEDISSDGSHILYLEEPGIGDATLRVHKSNGQNILTYQRVSQPTFTDDGRHVVFLIHPHRDSLRALKRLKTKEDDLPKDTLGIYDISNDQLLKKPDAHSFSIPEEWNNAIIFSLNESDNLKDTTKVDSIKVEPKKKSGDKNGRPLVIYRPLEGSSDTLEYVKAYELARSVPGLIYHSSGQDSSLIPGIYRYDLSDQMHYLLASGDYQYEQLAMSHDATQAAFLLNKEDPNAYIPQFELYHWQGKDTAHLVVNSSSPKEDWIINHHQQVVFSENGQKIFFSTAPPPIVKDTSLLEDDVIQVEVWSYKDQRLQTQQNVQKDRDEKKGYLAVFHTNSKIFQQLGNLQIPNVSQGPDRDRNHQYAFGRNPNPYLKSLSWEGNPTRGDIYLVDQGSGNSQLIAEGIRGSGDLSPDGKFLVWYNLLDTAFYVYDINHKLTINVSASIPSSIVDELDDHPDYPPPYGIAGWLTGDSGILIYDRYDIWQVNPANPSELSRLTDGRTERLRHRIRHLDPERPYVDFGEDLIHRFSEVSRDESLLKLNDAQNEDVLCTYSGRISDLHKARRNDAMIFSVQNQHTFADLSVTNDQFENVTRISNTNPQQIERKWSSVEFVNWTSLDGLPLEGLLYKPEDFDSSRKYPMIVYFYERNADNIHRYWGAFPHRSIINPTVYASQGYLVFVPDIVYRDGYPGPSCYNAVIPGVTHLIDKGFVDIDHIGMQGHSWGGYQTAYLATRTNLFACAESGAPVANMISAYGGIRWGSGMSRMFQYERTQSRLGGTLWELPMRYFENSPIFFVDKINTPMLLMHNDHDTAVPWYQGIELFVALRRLDKPAWMLNYNDEPHWPTKRENIVDFNIRMQQFFDHYLKGANIPVWMSEGIPAIEKGYNKGY